jgi:hypothetical protein
MNRVAVEVGEQTELAIGDSGFAGAPEAAPEGAAPTTAQTLVAEWIDGCAKRPPGQTIGHASKQIKKLLDEGIDPDDVRRGLSRWMAKGSAPTAIPSFVNEVMNADPGRGNVVDFRGRQQQESDAMFQRQMDRARAREQQGSS